MDLQDIKGRIFRDKDGWNNYMNVSIEEMDWLVEQAEKAEMYLKTLETLRDYTEERQVVSIYLENIVDYVKTNLLDVEIKFHK